MENVQSPKRRRASSKALPTALHESSSAEAPNPSTPRRAAPREAAPRTAGGKANEYTQSPIPLFLLWFGLPFGLLVAVAVLMHVLGW